LKLLAILFALLILGAMAVSGGVLYAFYHYGRDLPDYQQLANYDPPTVTRVHAGDGRLLEIGRAHV
jgi:penicillin-binding protein 1A